MLLCTPLVIKTGMPKHRLLTNAKIIAVLLIDGHRVADPERFDANPTFKADADPDPILLARERKEMPSKSSTILSKILQNFSWVIFSVLMIQLTKKHRYSISLD